MLEALAELIECRGVPKDQFMAEIERQAAEAEAAVPAYRDFIIKVDPETEGLIYVCPWCDSIDSMCEVDQGVRWNSLNEPEVEQHGDNVYYKASASIDGDNGFESSGYVCRDCCSEKINAPDNFEITDWT